MALTRVQPEQLLAKLSKLSKEVIQVIGKDGKQGERGKDGVTTTIKEVIHVREDGKIGDTGAAPEHEVRNGEIRFKNPDGTWGKWITVQASAGYGGGSKETVKYIAVKQAFYKVNRGSLVEGTNIFGVNFAGDVEIILPNGIDKNIIIVVKDESNSASTNNITVTKGP